MKKIFHFSKFCWILIILLMTSCNKYDKNRINRISANDYLKIKDTLTKPTVLYFWYFKCDGCTYELPKISNFCNKNNIQLINITSSDYDEKDTKSDLLALKKEKKITNLFFIDYKKLYGNKEVNNYFMLDDFCKKAGINKKMMSEAPYSVFLNKDGKIIKDFYNTDSLFSYIKKYKN